MMTRTFVRLRPLIFHPLPVLFFSLIGASLYAASAALRFSGDTLFNQYLYVVPILVPFVAFLFDRAERFSRTNIACSIIDALVVGLATWRAVGHVPFVSGHALFLIYASLGAGSRTVRITALMVLAEVLYLKLFVWHDWVTPLGGILLGSVAALVWRQLATSAELSDRYQVQ